MTSSIVIQHDTVDLLITRWRSDPSATYRSWFLWEERLKNFRSIRRGLAEVVTEIEADSFGSAYKGSSLETVVGSIAEQRQLFKGADHAWLWKPKLRIPDIYENRDNQLAFGRFLHACSCCDTEPAVLAAIRQLGRHEIKGLGPTAANLLYFLHPTIVPPFNTAIVNGYNALTGARVRLGRWDDFLAMREGILTLNARHRACSRTTSARSPACYSTSARGDMLRHHAPTTPKRGRVGKRISLAYARTRRTWIVTPLPRVRATGRTPRSRVGSVISATRSDSTCGSPRTT